MVKILNIKQKDCATNIQQKTKSVTTNTINIFYFCSTVSRSIALERGRKVRTTKSVVPVERTDMRECMVWQKKKTADFSKGEKAV